MCVKSRGNLLIALTNECNERRRRKKWNSWKSAAAAVDVYYA